MLFNKKRAIRKITSEPTSWLSSKILASYVMTEKGGTSQGSQTESGNNNNPARPEPTFRRGIRRHGTGFEIVLIYTGRPLNSHMRAAMKAGAMGHTGKRGQ